MILAEIVKEAPHPKRFYDKYDGGDLADIWEKWPGTIGSVHLFSCECRPGWYLAVQSPDHGLLERSLDRFWPELDNGQIIATWTGKDRVALLAKVCGRLAKIADEKTKGANGFSQWFKISDKRIKDNLPALIRSIS